MTEMFSYTSTRFKNNKMVQALVPGLVLFPLRQQTVLQTYIYVMQQKQVEQPEM